MNSTGKDLQALARKLQQQGWTRRIGGNGHIVMTPPNGGRPLVLSRSPSRGKALLRAKADLRRIGKGRRHR